MRRLAYKIKKAKKAHYILMNFELDAKWINDFKSLLDKDERVIRHLVIKRDEAITEDCPPPPEFHTLRSGMDDDDEEEDDIDYDDEDYAEDWDEDGDIDVDGYEDDIEAGIIPVDTEEDEDKNNNSTRVSKRRERKLSFEKVGR